MSELIIATWNVNSIRARLPRVVAWLQKTKPDIVCIQETKVEDSLFPREEIEKLGYHCEIYGQKTYNGVAILSKTKATGVARGLPDDGDTGQRRLIAASYPTGFGDVRIVNVYVPNGESVDSEKYIYKLEWMRKLRKYLDDQCNSASHALLCGDFNVAPEDRDVHDPERWRGKVLFSDKERVALSDICKFGLRDALREKTQEGGLYSWWDYRMGAFHRGWGLRIDLILVTDPLAKRCREVSIDRDERKGTQPSDHAPVVGTFV